MKNTFQLDAALKGLREEHVKRTGMRFKKGNIVISDHGNPYIITRVISNGSDSNIFVELKEYNGHNKTVTTHIYNRYDGMGEFCNHMLLDDNYYGIYDEVIYAARIMEVE